MPELSRYVSLAGHIPSREKLHVFWINPEWHAGDPAAAEHSNPFFRSLYENVAALLRAGETFLHQLEAREHTAQVDSEMRELREHAFREARLPVLFCSPTMELGVDIAQLNTVLILSDFVVGEGSVQTIG
jgi:hypothetical protein